MLTWQLLILGSAILMGIPTFAEKLKLVQVLFRHGAKAPTYLAKLLYPLDPYYNATWYPEGWDGLTNVGKKNSYELGSFLKERYGKWLGDVYLPQNIIFRSSLHDRVIMSTQIVAAALFPPSEIQRWDSNLNWQPIPVFSDAITTKTLYSTTFDCRKFLIMRHELEKTDEFLLNRTAELAEIFDHISKNVGRKMNQMQSAFIYHYLQAQLLENVELPEWLKNIFPDGALKRICAYDYVIQSYNTSLIQLNGGLWIRELLRNVDSHLNEQPSESPRAIIYGGHECNVAGLLQALGVIEEHLPYYCSAVILELSELEEQLYVKVLYRNKGILQELVIPRCGNVRCPLSTFRQLFADIITDQDVAAIC